MMGEPRRLQPRACGCRGVLRPARVLSSMSAVGRQRAVMARLASVGDQAATHSVLFCESRAPLRLECTAGAIILVAFIRRAKGVATCTTAVLTAIGGHAACLTVLAAPG